MPTIQQVSEHTNWDAIASIFNHYVDSSTAAYPSQKLAGNFFNEGWISNPNYPYYEVIDNETLVGFAFMRPFHPADSMQHAVVFTYFLAPSHTGKGIGTRLLHQLVQNARDMGKSNFLVNISSDNEGSIHFHAQNGFTECGRFREVGNKQGNVFDMVWMQRIDS